MANLAARDQYKRVSGEVQDESPLSPPSQFGYMPTICYTSPSFAAKRRYCCTHIRLSRRMLPPPTEPVIATVCSAAT